MELWILIQAFIFLLFLRNIYEFICFALPCFHRWKILLSIEHNLPQARTRNKVLICLSPCLFMCLNLIRAQDGFTINSIAPILAFFLLRILLYSTIKHRLIPHEEWNATRNSVNVFLCFALLIWIVSLTICFALSCSTFVIRNVLLGELSLCFFICFIRQGQILASHCGSLLAFLYLCALEIIPLALLATCLALL